MREQVKECLQRVCPNIDFETEVSLIESGILDSLSIIQIICALTDTFEIEIDADDIVVENFNSLSDLCDLVTRKRGN